MVTALYRGEKGGLPPVIGEDDKSSPLLISGFRYILNTVFIHMLTYIYTVGHFIHILLISCVFNPVNWNQCVRVHQWLPPYMVDLQQFKTNPPYSKEKSAVQLRQEYERVQRNLPSDTNRSQLVPSILQK